MALLPAPRTPAIQLRDNFFPESPLPPPHLSGLHSAGEGCEDVALGKEIEAPLCKVTKADGDAGGIEGGLLRDRADYKISPLVCPYHYRRPDFPFPGFPDPYRDENNIAASIRSHRILLGTGIDKIPPFRETCK